MSVVPRYSDEFKRDAVALVLGGMSQKRVCADLGLAKSTLSGWLNRADPTRGHTPKSQRNVGVFPDAGTVALQRRVKELEEENYILRRASAYLAQQPRYPK